MAYTFSPKICNTWEVTLDEARTQFYRQLYLQTFYIEIKFREESKGERNFSDPIFEDVFRNRENFIDE